MSLRYQLQDELWRRGVRVGVLPPRSAPSVDVYPVVLPDDVEAGALERKLSEVEGRLNVKIRGAWLPDGDYSLELPRANRQRVDFERLTIPDEGAVLPWLLGIDNTGRCIIADMADMPHLLVAGATGAGKSNAMNAALAHLVMTRTPEQVNLLLVDPKRVDLLAFRDMPHTLAHVADISAVAGALEQLTDEMQRRYRVLEQAGVKNIATYNRKAKKPLPYIVCVIDEWGMLMDAEAKTLEPSMLALLQVARASGIHVVLGTQRPDADTLRARLRGNLRFKVCFRVNDAKSSSLIIEDDSATGLLGEGDGLYKDSGGTMGRFQSPYIDEQVLEKCLAEAGKQDAPAQMPMAFTPALTVDPSLSRLEQAKMLCRQLEWVNASELKKAGIVSSGTAGRNLIAELREAGIVGHNDPSKKASPVLATSIKVAG